MTHQLSEVIERVKTWPAWRQDDAAYLLEMLEESGTSVYRLSDEERDAVQHEEAGNSDRAIADYSRAKELDPDSASYAIALERLHKRASN